MYANVTLIVAAALTAAPPGLRPVDLPPPPQPVGQCPGTGACDEPNGTPGCSDATCCNLVCMALPQCCFVGWDASCVSFALDKCGPLPCAGAQGCQITDNETHGGGAQNAFFGLSSDAAVGTRAADNFNPLITGTITSICWWGLYFDFDGGTDCGEGATDSFTITYYDDDQGLPGAVIDSFTVTPSRAAGGSIGGGEVTVHRFDATHAPVAVTGGQCYWLEVRDTLDAACTWLWSTAPPADGYAVVDDDGTYDLGDTGNWDHAWCLNLPVGSLDPCAPPTPQEACDPSDVELTQSNDADTILLDNSLACSHNPGGNRAWNLNSYYARSYNLGAIAETAGQSVAVECVQLGVEVNNGGASTLTVNVYEDTNGGGPTNPGVDLSLLGSTEVIAPGATSQALLTATFDPPVDVPTDASLVIEVYQPSRSPNSDGDSGILILGSNDLGQTAPSLFRSPDCNIDNYVTLASVGFADTHIVQRVVLQIGGTPCPWDCGKPANGMVDTVDFLTLLGQWGQVGVSCDFDGGGVGTTDFLGVLGMWGPCPP